MRAGQRIRLIEMVDDPDPIPPGAEGMIREVQNFADAQLLYVDWDDGHSLNLSVPPDKVEFLGEYHAKVSKVSVLCGESIFGKLTNAEGYVVTCKKCLERMQ